MPTGRRTATASVKIANNKNAARIRRFKAWANVFMIKIRASLAVLHVANFGDTLPAERAWF